MKVVMMIVTAGTLCLAGVGCRSVAVYEKARLQDPLMKYEESAQETHFYQKVYYSREGSVGAMSATVVAQSAELADAVATALCVLGPVEGLKLVERQKRIEAVIVGMDGRVHVSTGLKSEVARAAALGHRLDKR